MGNESVVELFERHKNKSALKILKYLQFRLQKSKWEAAARFFDYKA